MTIYTDYGPGDEATWAPCTGHPCDPRTDDEDFLSWEESASYADLISWDVIDSVLFNLRHSSPTEAREELDAALRDAFAQGISTAEKHHGITG